MNPGYREHREEQLGPRAGGLGVGLSYRPLWGQRFRRRVGP